MFKSSCADTQLKYKVGMDVFIDVKTKILDRKDRQNKI